MMEMEIQTVLALQEINVAEEFDFPEVNGGISLCDCSVPSSATNVSCR